MKWLLRGLAETLMGSGLFIFVWMDEGWKAACAEARAYWRNDNVST